MGSITQDEIMSKCWENPLSRECSYCRASHKRAGGQCCFGLRYEEDDPQCQDCPHTRNCRMAITMGYGGRTVVRKVGIGRPKVTSQAASPEDRLTSREEYEIDEPGERKLTLEHTVRRACHGAVEGACELILGSLRFRRPPP